MSDSVSLPVFLRPLQISGLNDPLPVNVSHEQGAVALDLLGEMLHDKTSPVDVARRRYAEVTDETVEPTIVPLHDVILRHVIQPLKEAKQCYILGMPVPCIAQAGLVGEMVALWRFRMLEPRLDGRLDQEIQQLLRGREFDKLGQEERVRVLRAIDTLDEALVQAFGALRAVRHRYLHFMVDPLRDADRDAREALGHACTLVVRTLDMKFADGDVVLPPRVMRYISDILKPEGDATVAGPRRVTPDAGTA